MPAPAAALLRLVDDAAMFPPGNAPVCEAVSAHREYRAAWFAELIGPLVVADRVLAEVSRAAGEDPVTVSVVNTGGAGGLLSLARREVPGVRVAAVESALRDLDDLAGNAARVLAAADELPGEPTVYVEVPYAPGWERAVAEVEAAGRLGKIRTGGLQPGDVPTRARLAEQLAGFVEADLPFKATAGLHHAVAVPGRDAEPHQHGFGNLLLALDALIDGAGPSDAAALLGQTDPAAVAGGLADWDAARWSRVRRRFRSFGCCGVTDPVHDLVSLGLLAEPPSSGSPAL